MYSSLFTNHLVSVPITIGNIFISCFLISSVFNQSPGTNLSFHILSILLCCPPGRQNLQFGRFYYYFYFTPWRVFHISVSWYVFTGGWVTASVLEFPGLFSVFWPILIMLNNFQIHQFLYQIFGDCTEHTNYNWDHRHFHFPYFFSVL